MTLLELYEPLFLYICELNRSLRLAAHKTKDYGAVRAEIKSLLQDISQKSASDVKLAGQAKKLELPIIFFVDSVIASSRHKFADQWNMQRLAYDHREKAGDEKFYDLLDESLKEFNDEASERLGVYFTCLALGFTGMHAGQPEEVRRYMENIFPRIRHSADSDLRTKICDDAYKSVDTRDLRPPANNRFVIILIVFLFFAITVFVAYYIFYMSASDGLRESLRTIIGTGN